jgi:hypothetical protein
VRSDYLISNEGEEAAIQDNNPGRLRGGQDLAAKQVREQEVLLAVPCDSGCRLPGQIASRGRPEHNPTDLGHRGAGAVPVAGQFVLQGVGLPGHCV